jgi:hypothetical protein
MTRERFIKKWLCTGYGYTEEKRDEMCDDLDKVTEQQCDYIQQLFAKPQEVFKPLQELYRKENPHPNDKFYIPNATQFFKWIANKVNEYECLRDSEHLLNIPCVSVQCEHTYAIIIDGQYGDRTNCLKCGKPHGEH